MMTMMMMMMMMMSDVEHYNKLTVFLHMLDKACNEINVNFARWKGIRLKYLPQLTQPNGRVTPGVVNKVPASSHISFQISSSSLEFCSRAGPWQLVLGHSIFLSLFF